MIFALFKRGFLQDLSLEEKQLRNSSSGVASVSQGGLRGSMERRSLPVISTLDTSALGHHLLELQGQLDDVALSSPL